MSKLREIEEAMLRHSDPVVSVPEIADELDRSTTHIRDQLRLLEREGAVHSKDVGARAVAWWHEERVAPRHVPPEDHPDQSDLVVEEAAEASHGAESAMVNRDAVEGDLKSVTQAVVNYEALDSVDFPESKAREDCLSAVVASWEYLRNHGPASMREIVTTVGAEHPIGYDVPDEIDGRYRGAWWRSVVKPGLEALPDVEKPTGGASEWRVEE